MIYIRTYDAPIEYFVGRVRCDDVRDHSYLSIMSAYTITLYLRMYVELNLANNKIVSKDMLLDI
jgi:hypothetical protein